MNKIILGDCSNLIQELKDESIDLIATDPPYLIDYKTNRRKDKTHEFTNVIQNDANPQLIIDLMPELYRVLKPDSAMYMFCSMDKVDFFKQEIEKYLQSRILLYG